ncbi:DUF3108 domain-containing protein [Rhodoblastus acidophilus]|uniref:DUF3108 domain-containing protein n=1 Tax=Candidatus Rhodoblastus alkanivorans TaxID=2954117 RepID=A0ABS9Z400_9HYPH|nr:DUF3108 domain-containing protein [Candidatus Rhodoblastus alkanivorans]MCI4677543.1 DUF3108 domain-containing protein [Candidatus Rhodoblastus alkanivorans]MCI4681902.1 DUF3108 domain-containing protein [Candidatus Rhodoblastus alkanivorans]MDI4642952.1 DUF3108 domain-containing protein [Rhodoblastus acidophilus]
MKGFVSRSLALFGATLAAAAPAGGTAMSETMHANYRVSLIGVPIGVAVANAYVAQSHYKVALNVRLTGVAAWIASLRMALASSGSYQDGELSPSGYATIASNSRETRTLRMAMSERAVRQIQYSPPWYDENNPDRVPLTEASKHNIIDPLSAFIMPAPAGESAVGPAACNRRVPVFDGYTRFDIALSYVEVKEISTRGYSGPVTVCAARYIPIAGHKPDNKSTQFMANNKDMNIWLAPVPHMPLVVPYRVSLMTMAGTAVIEASELRFAP